MLKILKTKYKRIINLLLVLSLLVAPFQVVFANAHMPDHESMANDAKGTLNTDQQTALHSTLHSTHHSTQLSNLHADPDADKISYDMTNNDCEKKCSHCVFCGVVIISPFYANDKVLSVYNPLITNYPSGIISEVDIRPPRFSPSIS